MDKSNTHKTKKAKVEYRRSPRPFLHLGSVVKTEEGVKIVLRRSTRLEIKRKMMELEKEDAVEKKSKTK